MAPVTEADRRLADARALLLIDHDLGPFGSGPFARRVEQKALRLVQRFSDEDAAAIADLLMDAFMAGEDVGRNYIETPAGPWSRLIDHIKQVWERMSRSRT
jgi:hypothetical protein